MQYACGILQTQCVLCHMLHITVCTFHVNIHRGEISFVFKKIVVSFITINIDRFSLILRLQSLGQKKEHYN